MKGYIAAGAIGVGGYRYRLWRQWEFVSDQASLHARTVTFVMLNPSTADAEKDDPTIRRCVAFTRAWGASELHVVNLTPYRATDPSELRGRSLDELEGDKLEQYAATAEALRRSQTVVCAWGQSGPKEVVDRGRARLRGILQEMLRRETHRHVVALGRTASGEPRHPLYVRASTVPEPFDP